MSRLRMKAGNALVEYGIIGALIAVTSITAITFFGDGLNTLLTELKGDFGKNLAAAGKASANASGSGPIAAGSSSGPGVNTATKLSLTLTSGNEITVDNYPSEIQEALDVSGANGTTDLLASTMQNIADQLLREGEITPEEADVIRQLANKGHELAMMQGILEDTLKSYTGDIASLDALPLTVNGKPTTVGALRYKIGYKGDDGNGGVIQGVYLQEFLDIHRKAEASGMYSNPEVKQIIDVLTNQIANISNGTENALYDIINKGESPEQFAQLVYKGYQSENQQPDLPDSLTGIPSADTHAASGGICHAGNNTDTGTACQ